MSLLLTLRNRQRSRPVNMRWLRQIARALLQGLLEVGSSDIGIYLVAAPEMTRLNETFLCHKGPTDVITFDYGEKAGCKSERARSLASLHGEIFICLDEAVIQARHFRTTWQSELARYLIHGVLHLQGFNDQDPAQRSKMKREEARLLRQLARRFSLAQLAQVTL